LFGKDKRRNNQTYLYEEEKKIKKKRRKKKEKEEKANGLSFMHRSEFEKALGTPSLSTLSNRLSTRLNNLNHTF
jgi:hypothetical protein